MTQTKWLVTNLPLLMICLTRIVLADGADNSGKDLSGKSFAGRRLEKSTFEKSILKSTSFAKAIMNDVNLRKASMESTDFSGAKLARADFRGAKFNFALFQNADLTQANFEEANLSKQGFYSCTMREVNFRNLEGATTFSRCDLQGADFRGANLSGLQEGGVPSNFQDAKYDSNPVWPTNFDPEERGLMKVEEEDVKPDEEKPKDRDAPKSRRDAPKSRKDEDDLQKSGRYDSVSDAAALLQARKYAEAEAMYRKLYRENKKDPEVIGGLANALIAQKKSVEAEKLLQQLEAIPKDSSSDGTKDNSFPRSPEKNWALVAPAAPPPGAPGSPAAPPREPSDPNPGTKVIGSSSREAKPAVAKLNGNAPQGLFFMVRYWPFNQTREKAAWYFSPDGDVYQNLESGFSKDDLASHRGPKGKFKAVGNVLEVTWSNGDVSRSLVERDGSGFAWDMGLFTPVTPLRDASVLTGVYEGGESLSHGGNQVAASKTLRLNSDGTFFWESIGLARGATSGSILYAGSTQGTRGTYEVSDYSVTLKTDGGETFRLIAFPFDEEGANLHPSHVFIGGMMYKKLQ